ncbi:MAG: ADP-heptose synthase, partial [Actinobacteria bacterium]|nr:ADP-heptose synthase [Actinomycetota bacterium]
KEFCTKTLEQEGVNYDLLVDTTRTTTVKERFRSQGKTLLRVSHLQQSSISIELQEKLIKKAMTLLVGCDLLLFSDFNYGVLPQALVDKLIEVARENKIIIAADSQTSSQVGDVSRFRGVDLLMPTEREARVSLQSREEGLVVLAEQLRQKADGRNILLKLGADGVLIHAPDYKSDGWLTDQVDALNKFPKDVAGAGDSMLVGSALALAAGSSIWEAACVGSIVAAVQVGRIGNLPVNASLLNQIIDQ